MLINNIQTQEIMQWINARSSVPPLPPPPSLAPSLLAIFLPSSTSFLFSILLIHFVYSIRCPLGETIANTINYMAYKFILHSSDSREVQNQDVGSFSVWQEPTFKFRDNAFWLRIPLEGEARLILRPLL